MINDCMPFLIFQIVAHTKLMVRMAKQIDKIEWDTSFRRMCPWLDMAETERSRTKNLRGAIFNKLGVNNSTVTCWLTGFNCAVKVAHILPDSARTDVLQRLELDAAFKNDTINPRNFLILAEAIEEAFDSMQISFCPNDVLNPTKLYLKIWNDEIRNQSVGGDVDPAHVRALTFRDLETSAAMLTIPAGWNVSLRALSYHNLCCYIYQKSKGTESLDPDMPADFSAPGTAAEKDKARADLVRMLQAAKKIDLGAEEEALDYNEFYESIPDIQEEVPTPPPRKRKDSRSSYSTTKRKKSLYYYVVK